MIDSKQNESQNGLGVKTQAVVSDEGQWFTLLTLQIGILSASVAVPVDAVPNVASAIRKALLDGHKDTLQAQTESDRAKLAVMENKLIIPGRD